MNDKQDLLSKREEVAAKLKQAEADIYFLQGYLQALNDQIAELEKEAQNGNQ